MKIISKFNDYYDGISKSFYDDEIIFNRKFELIKIPSRFDKYTSPNIAKLVRLFDEYDSYSLFDTKNRKSISERYDIKNRSSMYDSKNNVFYYKCILGYCGKLYHFFLKDSDNESITIENNHIIVSEKLMLHSFSENHNSGFIEIFIELDTPLFLYVIRKSTIIKNPSLSYLNIAQHKNPMQVYQDVSMFISNILVNKEKSDVVISDKDLIIGKGFDYKTSFRKEKEI